MEGEINLPQVLLSFLFVLGLIGIFALLLKKFNMGGFVNVKPAGEKRLQITETCMIDTRRKLVLVRRDKTEHLLLVSPERQMVIESFEKGEGV